LAIISIVIMLTLLTQLSTREALAMGITALLATMNWWWAKRRELQKSTTEAAALSAQ
jgi:hypothetical protein